jgi:hypothetical protein
MREFIEYRRNKKEHVDSIPKKDPKISTKMKKKFGKTSEVMEGFCFIIFITSLNRPNAGKDDDETM